MLREVKPKRKVNFTSRKRKDIPAKRSFFSTVAFILRIVLILGIPIIFFLLPQVLIKINNLSCRNQFGPCTSYVENKLSSLKGDNLWIFRKGISKALDKDTIVENYSYLYKFPDNMEVNVLERIPKFALKRHDSQTFALVDKDGTVLSFSQSSNLPFINADNSIPDKGKKVDSPTLFALNIISDLASYYNIQNGDKTDNDLTIIIQDKKVIFPLEGDEKALVGGFNLIYSKLKSNSNGVKNTNFDSVKTIDMRFKNPVLSF